MGKPVKGLTIYVSTENSLTKKKLQKSSSKYPASGDQNGIPYFGDTYRCRPWSGATSSGHPVQYPKPGGPITYWHGNTAGMVDLRKKRRAAGKKKKEEQGHSGNPKLLELVAAELVDTPASPTENTEVAVPEKVEA